MPTAAQRAEDKRINALAFRLCKRWQQLQKRKLSLDELGAFMSGVVASENERLQQEERVMSDQPKPQEKEQPKEVEKDKPLDQKVKETDHPPAGPPTVVVPPG